MNLNTIISSISFLTIASCYIVWKFKLKDSTLSDIIKDFIDVSPAFLSLYFCNNKCVVFLMMCLIANEFIYDNIFMGAGFFALGYVLASVFSILFSVSLIKIGISLALSVLIIVPLVCVYKGDVKFKIGAVSYGFITLPFLFYAFCITWNPGFLSLVVGDTLLLVGEMFPSNKIIRTVSDLFYFFGTCFVPLSLSGGWII